jgi:RNA polymerase primary sigma factor
MSPIPATLSAAEERRLARRARGGDVDARNRLVEANVRLVAHLARRLRPQTAGVSHADLVQEGVLGLMRAIDGFEPHRGHRLSTYATWWIRAAMLRALAEEGRPMRLPSPVARRAWALARAERRLAAELGREPTAGELAAELGGDEAEVGELRRAAAPVVSLHAPVGGARDATLADLLPDDRGSDPHDDLTRVEDAEDLAAIVRALPPRARRILELRFGLDGTHPHSLAEAARALGTSQARARALEEHALARLRALPATRALLAA